jgi:hypothetical protein
VTSPDLFRLVFRYVNRGSMTVSGQVSMREEAKLAACTNCEWEAAFLASPCPVPPQHTLHPSPSCPSHVLWTQLRGGAAWGSLRAEPEVSFPSPGTDQSQLVAFPPSTEPTFVTVPQRGFGEPFVLNPGVWALFVEAEGVLLVRQGPWRVGAGPGLRSLSTHLPSPSGLCGSAAQCLL